MPQAGVGGCWLAESWGTVGWAHSEASAVQACSRQEGGEASGRKRALSRPPAKEQGARGEAEETPRSREEESAEER